MNVDNIAYFAKRAARTALASRLVTLACVVVVCATVVAVVWRVTG